MYVKVNPAAMARSIQAFVKAAGGETSYSASLELVARLCGFDAYRAQKAYAEANAERDNIVFETIIQGWDRDDSEVSGHTESQAARRRVPYRFSVEHCGDQLRAALVPDDVKDVLNESQGRDVLDFFVEINAGLPCVHLTNDPAGEMLLTVFGHAGGLLVREDEARLEDIGAANEKLESYIKDENWEDLRWTDCSYVMNWDTAGKYGDGTDSKLDESSNRYRVVASFDDSVATTPGSQWFDLDVYERDKKGGEVDCEAWHVGLEVNAVDAFPAHGAEAFCNAMSRAFSDLFNRATGKDAVLAPYQLVQSCIAGGVLAAERLAQTASLYPKASFAELEKRYREEAARDGATSSPVGQVSLPKPRYTMRALFEDYTAPDFGRLAFKFFLIDTLDVKGPSEGRSFFMDSSFDTATPEKERTLFCETLCTAFSMLFNRKAKAGAPKLDEMALLKACLAGGTTLVQRLVEVAGQNPAASFEELEKLYRMTASVWTTVMGKR